MNSNSFLLTLIFCGPLTWHQAQWNQWQFSYQLQNTFYIVRKSVEHMDGASSRGVCSAPTFLTELLPPIPCNSSPASWSPHILQTLPEAHPDSPAAETSTLLPFKRPCLIAHFPFHTAGKYFITLFYFFSPKHRFMKMHSSNSTQWEKVKNRCCHEGQCGETTLLQPTARGSRIHML